MPAKDSSRVKESLTWAVVRAARGGEGEEGGELHGGGGEWGMGEKMGVEGRRSEDMMKLFYSPLFGLFEDIKLSFGLD